MLSFNFEKKKKIVSALLSPTQESLLFLVSSHRIIFQNNHVHLCSGMLNSCLPFPQRWCLSTCAQCSQMCCTAREILCPSASLCCSMTKSWWPPSSLTLLIPPSFSSIAIIPNGCRSSAGRSWLVVESWFKKKKTKTCFVIQVCAE